MSPGIEFSRAALWGVIGLARPLRAVVFGLTALALTGCQTFNFDMGGPTQPAPAPPMESIGTGSVTVALLLPTSASGQAGATARAMKNAAALALSDIPGADLRIVPLDSGGTPNSAEQAVRTALAQNPALIIGPLFASEVRAVGGPARTANVSVIAFSTDANVAAPGINLLSFLPEADIDRIVSYAARNGKRSFAALLPEDSYGSVVEAAFQQAVARNNGRVVAIERYAAEEGQMQAAVSRLASVASGSSPQVDALLLPGGPQDLSRIAPMLAAANIDRGRVQLLGSGQWNDESAWGIGGLEGGWFAGPAPSGWQTFRARYQAQFGSPPPRNATLAYDATSLAAALSRLHGRDGFTREILNNTDGFAGIDGVFRFRVNGTSQRGLAILEVREGTVRIRDGAPSAFAPGT